MEITDLPFWSNGLHINDFPGISKNRGGQRTFEELAKP